MGIELKKQCFHALQFANDEAIIASDKENIEYMMKKLMKDGTSGS